MSNRISNNTLVKAGVTLMRKNNKPIEETKSRGRSMIYELSNKETVRIRTCNDHVLICVASSPDIDAKLNIEGTDWILLVMPAVERTAGNIKAYLLPTNIVVEEVRKAHQKWLDSNPNTKGKNTTWNLWFREHRVPGRSGGYGNKWKNFLLDGEVSSIDTEDNRTEVFEKSSSSENGNIRNEVEKAKHRLADLAGVKPEAVRISIDFSI